jgi:hypothetical protein
MNDLKYIEFELATEKMINTWLNSSNKEIISMAISFSDLGKIIAFIYREKI